jgi:uncharacterized protein (UPF0333 family)
MLKTTHAVGIVGREGVVSMRTKIIACLVIVAASAGLFVIMRGENRAQAAASDCYSEAQGPATPTVCG